MPQTMSADELEWLLRHTLQQVPVGIAILHGRDYIIDSANDAYLQIVDRTAEEVIGKSLFTALPEVKESVSGLLDGVMSTGKPYHGFEFPVTLNRYGQAELTYFNFVYQPLKKRDGEIAGIIVVANEVTTQVKTKQLLEERGRVFHGMVMNAPIAMAILRGERHVIELANTFLLEKIWRKKNEEVVGRSILDVFPELATQKYPALLDRVFQTGITYQEKESHALVESGDGPRDFYLDYEYAPLFGELGKVTGIMITVYDVTEKVIVHRELEDANEKFRQAVDFAGIANWELDLVNHSIQYSPRLMEIFGWPPDTIITHEQLRGQLLPEDSPSVLSAFKEALQKGCYTYEARIRKPDRSVSWIKTLGRVFYNQHGEAVRIIGTLRDISEEKMFAQEMERQVNERTRELADKNAALEKMNADLQTYAYISSHDLQEPLRKIQMFSSRIIDRDLPQLSPAGADDFRRIQNAAHTMQVLIKDLLAYTRMSTGEKMFETTDINHLIESVREALKEQLDSRQVKLKTQDLGKAYVIPFQFKQLLINLLSNSIKFTRADVTPEIEVHATIVKGDTLHFAGADKHINYYHLAVSDNGIGFEPIYKEKIFEIFQKLNNRSSYNGTGIGLAIVKKIAENHNGFVSASSELGQGAHFDIYIPELTQQPRL